MIRGAVPRDGLEPFVPASPKKSDAGYGAATARQCSALGPNVTLRQLRQAFQWTGAWAIRERRGATDGR